MGRDAFCLSHGLLNCVFILQVAGFARSVRSHGTRFVRVVVRRAGHILPADEPAVARDMMERFVFDREF